MGVKFTVYTDGWDAVKEALAKSCTKAEHALAKQVKDDTEPFVPALTRSLANRTRVVGNMVIYPGPYARYLYYGKVMVNAATMKGPMHFIDEYGNEQIKFPEGSHLVATDRDLNISKAVHKQACSHWFEASKAQNLDKWLRVVKGEITNEH